MRSFLAVIDPPWSRDSGGGGKGANAHYELANPSRIAEGYWKARDNEGKRIWPQPGGDDPALVFMWATTGAMTMPEDADVRQVELVPSVDPFKPPDAYVLARLLGLRVCATFVWCKVDLLRDVIGSANNDLDMALRALRTSSAPSEAMMIRDVRDSIMRAQHHIDAASGFAAATKKGIGQWSRCEHEFLLLCRHGDVSIPPPEARPRSVIYAPRGEHSEKPEQAWRQVIEPIAWHCMPDRVGVEFNCRSQRPGWAAFGALDGEDKPLRYSPDMPMATR